MRQQEYLDSLEIEDSVLDRLVAEDYGSTVEIILDVDYEVTPFTLRASQIDTLIDWLQEWRARQQLESDDG